MSASIDLGFCWFFPETFSPEEGLARLKDCGFDGIELWPHIIDRFGADRWARALRNTGMRCLQLCPYFNFVSGPEKIRESWESFRRFCQLAGQFECKRIRVFTGPPWGEGVVGAKNATEAQWSAATENLSRFCALAPELEFCLECHEGSLMEDTPSTLRLLRAVPFQNLTTNLQLPLLNEDWRTGIESLGHHTTHIHIHNWSEGLGTGDLTFLGDGVFDWVSVLELILSKNQGRLCLSVEHADHGGLHDPWETAERDGTTLRAWRARLVGAGDGRHCMENVFSSGKVLTKKNKRL